MSTREAFDIEQINNRLAALDALAVSAGAANAEELVAWFVGGLSAIGQTNFALPDNSGLAAAIFAAHED